MTRQHQPQTRPELVAALGKQAQPAFGHRLAPRTGIWIRQRVEQHRHVSVRDVALSLRGRRGEDEHQRRDEGRDPGHATARVGENRDAPKIRGISMMTAGTTNTSARNATAMVSASSPPNHAVGL